jgi:hypothetical protein
MPGLKYWNGTAWVSFLDQGAAPAPPAPPAFYGQPGSVVHRGTANITNLNTSVGGLYDVTTYLVGFTAPGTTQLSVVAALYAGFGGSDVVFSGDIYAIGPNAVAAASPSPIHCHAGYWVHCPIVASWALSPGMDHGFKVRVNYQSGSNIHTAGGVNWIVTAL